MKLKSFVHNIVLTHHRKVIFLGIAILVLYPTMIVIFANVCNIPLFNNSIQLLTNEDTTTFRS
jgi:hypothetical protein